MREARRLVEGVLHVAADLLEERLRGGGVGVERGLRELEPHCERHQVLLHAAVQLALDPATVGIVGADEPCPRRAQLGELRVQTLDLIVISQWTALPFVGSEGVVRDLAPDVKQRNRRPRGGGHRVIHLLPP